MKRYGTIAGLLVIVVLLAIALIWNSRRPKQDDLDARVAEAIATIETAMGMKFKSPPRHRTAHARRGAQFPAGRVQ